MIKDDLVEVAPKKTFIVPPTPPTHILSKSEKKDVKVALNVIRKAHTKGSKSDRERMRMIKRSQKNKKGLLVKVDEKDKHLFDDGFQLRTIDDIIQDARDNFTITKDRKKLEKMAKKYGQLRPLFTEDIAEIKKIQRERIRMIIAKRRQEQSENQNSSNANFLPRSDLDQPNTSDEEDVYNINLHDDEIDSRGKISRPLSANILDNKKTDNNFDILEAETANEIEEYLLEINSKDLIEQELQKLSLAVKFEENGNNCQSNNQEKHRQTIPQPPVKSTKVISFGTTVDQQSLSSPRIQIKSNNFVRKTIEEDEKVMKVLRIHEQLMAEKESKLLKKIEDRDILLKRRFEIQALRQKQKVWLSLVILTQYYDQLKDCVIAKRKENQWLQESKASRKAINLIRKWWRKQMIVIRFRRNPKAYYLLRSIFCRFRFKIRLRKKNKSVDLILNFLRASSIISESMKKIYSFRQNVIRIQCWIKSWFDLQQYRVRLLWLCTERSSQVLNKEERILRVRTEKKSMEALTHMSGFAEAAKSMNVVKNKLTDILDFQDEEARKRRDQLSRKISTMKLYGNHPDYSKKGSSSTPNLPPNLPPNLTIDTAPPKGNMGKLAALLGLNSDQITPMQSVASARKMSNRLPNTNKQNSSSMNLGASSSTNALPISSSSANLRSMGRRNAKLGDLGGNVVYMKLSSRAQKDPDMEAFYRKVKMTPNGYKIFESLRKILQEQRKRYAKKITAQQYHRRTCPVDLKDIRQYLKHPGDFRMAQGISQAIGSSGTRTLASWMRDFRETPFLLLTQGGEEAVLKLLQSNKHLRINA